MQIYAEAESRAKELVQFCYAEAQQYIAAKSNIQNKSYICIHIEKLC